jgi:catechol 2,3-dioxygenase-like lactoylglutathione lyase family enzyme
MRNSVSRPAHARPAVAATVLLSCAMTGAGALHAAQSWPIETSLDHVAFQVADMDRSIRFYSDNFGFRLTRRAEYAFNGTQTDSKNADLTAAFMHLGPTAIELIQIRKPVGAANPGEVRNPGVFHLGLYIKDVRAAYRHLSDSGVKFNSEPRLRDGAYTASLRDPDGVMLELMEVQSITVGK